jgi:hypothetical protein
MPIDPRISLGVQPLQVADPLAQYGQMQNILAAQSQQRAAGTQQQAAELQMQQSQRQIQQDEEYVTKMAEAIGKNGGPPDMMQAARIMAGNRNPQVSATGIQMLQSLQRLDAAKKAGVYGTPAPTAMPSVAPASGALGSGTFDPNAPVAAPMLTQAQRFAGSMGTNLPPTGAANQLAPAPAAPVNQLVDNTAALRAEYAKLSEYSDLPGVKDRMDEIKDQLKESRKLYTVDGNLVTATGKSVFTADKKENAPPAMVAEYTFAKTPEGGGFTGSYQQFVTARAAAGRAPAQPAPLQPPIAVIGPDGKEIYVTREEALTNRMSPAGKSALTESQGNAAMFGSAMAQAQQVLNQAEKEGTTTGAGTVNLAQGIVKYVPLGVGDKLVNDIYALAVNDPTKLFGPDVNQQKVGQAQLAFAIAYLRKTSGAAFGASEVANTIMEYFPSVGEDKAVVKQKAESRKRAIAGMKMGAGREGAKFIEQYESPSGGASGANKNVITDPKFPGFSIGNP